MILHALVDDYEVARAAIHGGATLVQLRLKDLPTPQLVEEGRPFRDLCARSSVTFVVNDDVEAAIALGADGVHLGRDDEGIEWARAAGVPALGLDRLREICESVAAPVVAIGGVDATNAALCLEAGAVGVAVVRASVDAAAVRTALERAAV